YCLNIKGIPYKTVWVEYPDIETVSERVGAAPTSTKPDGTPFYTCPFISDPNTQTAVSDTAAIARYLDKTYPGTHTLFPKETAALQHAFLRAFAAEVMPGPKDDFARVAMLVPQTYAMLNERSQPYFRRTREALLGQALEEVAPRGSERARGIWEGAREGFHAGIVFADVAVAGVLAWTRFTFGEESEEWKGVLGWDGGRWGRFMEKFRQYEAVDAGSYAEV
ncbi:hypothetical protein C8T65DRAFT_633549, partial [Cerioporus squamosus]